MSIRTLIKERYVATIAFAGYMEDPKIEFMLVPYCFSSLFLLGKGLQPIIEASEISFAFTIKRKNNKIRRIIYIYIYIYEWCKKFCYLTRTNLYSFKP